MKNIKVEDDVWEKLMRLKLDKKSNSLSNVIKELLKYAKSH